MNLLSRIKSVLLVSTIMFAAMQASARCGVLRWSIKTGSDQGISKIELSKIHPNTIENLIKLQAPKNLPQASRLSPTETEVYQLQATLLEVNQTDDLDYHLLIADSLGHQMIAEIPDQQCVANSSLLKNQIQSARNYIDQKMQVSHQPQKVNVPITLTGIGFFDVPHAQGAAANGIEIHPVLDITFSNTQKLNE
ncbi:MAG: hypothetical protein H7Z71_00525 [Moraxellaceae bacterium]|nr:hypothetical protein [Pseudobdellovibrionaceae bacterium]